MEQDIQADPVQISSVVGEDTTVQTIDRKSQCHIVNPKDFGGSAEEIQYNIEQTSQRKHKNMFDRTAISMRETVSGGTLRTHSILGPTSPTGLIGPKMELVYLCVDLH
eukprot:10887810-Ditylum_brightwellii.AAC.2